MLCATGLCCTPAWTILATAHQNCIELMGHFCSDARLILWVMAQYSTHTGVCDTSARNKQSASSAPLPCYCMLMQLLMLIRPCMVGWSVCCQQKGKGRAVVLCNLSTCPCCEPMGTCPNQIGRHSSSLDGCRPSMASTQTLTSVPATTQELLIALFWFRQHVAN